MSGNTRSQHLRVSNHANPEPEATAGTSKSDPSKDKDFWYEDGNIVLAARGVEFRVYKGVLADHSTVFADMFSFPQPTTLSSSPTVDLDDSPEDLRHILRALFPKKQTTFIPLELSNPTFDMISAYVRLGHKYQIDTLLDQSLSWLKNRYTTDFDTWCDQEDFPFDDDPTFAMGVVNLARLTQCDTVLPAAMAVCCMLDGEPLVDGFQREDGTRERLSDDDLRTCITAIRTLTQRSAALVLGAMRPLQGVRGCVSASQCSRALHELARLLSCEPAVLANTHPFCSWDYYVGIRLDEDAICGFCTEVLRERFREDQRRLWMDLPEILGIDVGGWD